MSQTTQAQEAPQESLAVPTPMHLIELAVQKGADADQLGKLLDLQLRWQANESRLAYIAAMHKFKENPPDINKTKKVSYPNKDGTITTYHHAELDDVVEIIGNALKAVGIGQSWRTSDSAGKIVVTCVLTHEQGHSEDVATLVGPPDVSGGKNNIQAIGSTTSYLQRYTLLAGTGLAAKGQDDDGRTEGMDSNSVEEYICALKDSAHVQELQQVFKECYQKAKAVGDKASMGAFIDAYEQRKKDLR
jgi:hypothetical protein